MANGTTETDIVPQSASHPSEKRNPRSLSQIISNKISNIVSGDNLFGSATILAYLYPQFKTISGGKARRDIRGRSAADKWRMRSGMLDILSNAGLFVSDRGAEAPEGNTVSARLINTLKHPNKSSVYFYRIAQIPVQATSIIANVEKGLAGMRAGGRKSERIRLASAAITAAGGIFYFIGMFGPQKKNHEQESLQPDIENNGLNTPKNEETLHPVYVVKSAFKRFPSMMLGAVCDVLLDLSLLSEAIMVNREPGNANRRSGAELAKAGAAAVALDTGINYYTWVQMVKESRNAARISSAQVR